MVESLLHVLIYGVSHKISLEVNGVCSSVINEILFSISSKIVGGYEENKS